ncbi:MAG: hypothetical protein U5N56_05895 [Candidatus Marinimicrobia bacterium]|nr:hypothetical protein [Candidatus Neomarinimicrobiota bacterium]
MKNTDDNKHSWYPLDTSAKIYPALESPENTNIFRFSMSLKSNIRQDLLYRALNIIKPRFPYYNVRLRSGLFWHYLEKNDNPFIIHPETPFPCERLYPAYNNGYLYRVRVYENRIAVEFSHILADGSGCMEFLKTLVTQYLVLKGELDSFPEGIMHPDDKPHPEEYEDAFLKVLEIEKHHLPHIPKQRSLFTTHRVFKIRDRVLPLGSFRIVSGIVPVEDVKSIAKRYHAKVTELLAALYIEALIHLQDEQIANKKKHRPVGLSIPVNMRNLYPIRSMRNFSLFIVPRIDPENVQDLGDIIGILKEFMRSRATKDNLLPMVKDNCSLSKNALIRFTPAAIKNVVIRYVSNTQGHAQFSGTLSNLGPVRLPEELEKHIDRIGFMLGPPTQTLTACAVLGFRNDLHITFGRVSKEAYVERHVFRRLVELGAHVSIKSN